MKSQRTNKDFISLALAPLTQKYRIAKLKTRTFIKMQFSNDLQRIIKSLLSFSRRKEMMQSGAHSLENRTSPKDLPPSPLCSPPRWERLPYLSLALESSSHSVGERKNRHKRLDQRLTQDEDRSARHLSACPTPPIPALTLRLTFSALSYCPRER